MYIPALWVPVEEGKVAGFLLATTGILQLHQAIAAKKMQSEVSICYGVKDVLVLCKFIEVHQGSTTQVHEHAPTSKTH